MDSTYKKILENSVNFEARFMPNHDELVEFTNYCKSQGKRIVLTQGVYDLVHQGHALYLEKAKSLGDILIVGLDTDALTKKRKGPSRPIVPEDERVTMLTHLRHVDIVTLRYVDDERTKLEEMIKPHVLVFSETTGDIGESIKNNAKQWCEEVVILPPQATTSTTARIRTLTIDGVQKLATEVNKLTQDFLEKIKSN